MLYKILIIFIICYLICRYYRISENYDSSNVLIESLSSPSNGPLTGYGTLGGFSLVVSTLSTTWPYGSSIYGITTVGTDTVYYWLSSNGRVFMANKLGTSKYVVSIPILNETNVQNVWPTAISLPIWSCMYYPQNFGNNNLGTISGLNVLDTNGNTTSIKVLGNVNILSSTGTITDTIYYGVLGEYVIMVNTTGICRNYPLPPSSSPSVPIDPNDDYVLVNWFKSSTPSSTLSRTHYSTPSSANSFPVRQWGYMYYPFQKKLGPITSSSIIPAIYANLPIINLVNITSNTPSTTSGTTSSTITDSVFYAQYLGEVIMINYSGLIKKYPLQNILGKFLPPNDIYVNTYWSNATVVSTLTPSSTLSAPYPTISSLIQFGSMQGVAYIGGNPYPLSGLVNIKNPLSSTPDIIYYYTIAGNTFACNKDGASKILGQTMNGKTPIEIQQSIQVIFPVAPSSGQWSYMYYPPDFSTTKFDTISGSLITDLINIPVIYSVNYGFDTIYYGIYKENVIMVSSNSVSKTYPILYSGTLKVPPNNDFVVYYWPTATTVTQWGYMYYPNQKKLGPITSSSIVPAIYANLPIINLVNIKNNTGTITDSVYYAQYQGNVVMINMNGLIKTYLLPKRTGINYSAPNDIYVSTYWFNATLVSTLTPSSTPSAPYPNINSLIQLGSMRGGYSVTNFSPINMMVNIIDPSSGISYIVYYWQQSLNFSYVFNNIGISRRMGTIVDRTSEEVRQTISASFYGSLDVGLWSHMYYPPDFGINNLGKIGGYLLTDSDGNSMSIPVLHSVSYGSDIIYYGIFIEKIIMVSSSGVSKIYDAYKYPIPPNDDFVFYYWPTATTVTQWGYMYYPTQRLGPIISSSILPAIYANLPIINLVNIKNNTGTITDSVYYAQYQGIVVMINMNGLIKTYLLPKGTGINYSAPNDIYVSTYWSNATLVSTLTPSSTPSAPYPNINSLIQLGSMRGGYSVTNFSPINMMVNIIDPSSGISYIAYYWQYGTMSFVFNNIGISRRMGTIVGRTSDEIRQIISDGFSGSQTLDLWSLMYYPPDFGINNLGTIGGYLLTDSNGNNMSIPVLYSVSYSSDTIYYGIIKEKIIMVSSSGVSKIYDDYKYPIPPNGDFVVYYWPTATTVTKWGYMYYPNQKKLGPIISSSVIPAIYANLTIINLVNIINITGATTDSVYYAQYQGNVVMINMNGLIKTYPLPKGTGISYSSPNDLYVNTYWPNASSVSSLSSSSTPSAPYPAINMLIQSGIMRGIGFVNTFPIAGVVNIIDSQSNMSDIIYYVHDTYSTYIFNKKGVSKRIPYSTVDKTPDQIKLLISSIFYGLPPIQQWNYMYYPPNFGTNNLGTISGSLITDLTNIPVLNSVSYTSDTIYYGIYKDNVIMVNSKGISKTYPLLSNGTSKLPPNDDFVVYYWPTATTVIQEGGYEYWPLQKRLGPVTSASIIPAIYANLPIIDVLTITSNTPSSTLSNTPSSTSSILITDSIYYAQYLGNVVMINIYGTIKIYPLKNGFDGYYIPPDNTYVNTYWPVANVVSSVSPYLTPSSTPYVNSIINMGSTLLNNGTYYETTGIVNLKNPVSGINDRVYYVFDPVARMLYMNSKNGISKSISISVNAPTILQLLSFVSQWYSINPISPSLFYYMYYPSYYRSNNLGTLSGPLLANKNNGFVPVLNSLDYGLNTIYYGLDVNVIMVDTNGVTRYFSPTILSNRLPNDDFVIYHWSIATTITVAQRYIYNPQSVTPSISSRPTGSNPYPYGSLTGLGIVGIIPVISTIFTVDGFKIYYGYDSINGIIWMASESGQFMSYSWKFSTSVDRAVGLFAGLWGTKVSGAPNFIVYNSPDYNFNRPSTPIGILTYNTPSYNTPSYNTPLSSVPITNSVILDNGSTAYWNQDTINIYMYNNGYCQKIKLNNSGNIITNNFVKIQFKYNNNLSLNNCDYNTLTVSASPTTASPTTASPTTALPTTASPTIILPSQSPSSTWSGWLLNKSNNFIPSISPVISDNSSTAIVVGAAVGVTAIGGAAYYFMSSGSPPLPQFRQPSYNYFDRGD